MVQGPKFALRLAALLLLLFTDYSGAQLSKEQQSDGKTPSLAAPSTCPSTSINHITQTLAQQCLTTSWTSKAVSWHSTAADSPHTSNGTATPSSVAVVATSVPAEISAQVLNSDTSLISSPTLSSMVKGEDVAPSLSTTETAKQPDASEDSPPESEVDSPLDNANFLSFEEWKRQNLAKAGQTAEDLGSRAGNGGEEDRRRPGNIHNALDSLGEDAEIDIDFRGFVNPGSLPSQSTGTHDGAQPTVKGQHGTASSEEITGARRRGKDAGKTCKERTNYASFDCAATVLKTNSECKGSTSVLVENKDSYLLNICKATNKFLIVELCDDILIDTIVLANFEFFSSMFRTFRVSVSDRYPVKADKWRDLGTFEARNTREVQAFLVENPLIWAKYLRVEFLTHFGNEYYCPVSLLRVHGTTMMEEFNHDVKGSRGDEDSDAEENELEERAGSEPFAAVVANGEPRDMPRTDIREEGGSSAAAPDPTTSDTLDGASDLSTRNGTVVAHDLPQELPGLNFTVYNFTITRRLEELLSSGDHDDPICEAEDGKPEEHTVSTSITGPVSQMTTETPQAVETSLSPKYTTVANASTQVLPSNGTKAAENATSSQTVVPSPNAAHAAANKTSTALQHTSASTTKTQSSSTQPPAPNPTTQESFFKSVHKRLQLLEANSTLSLQYIEEQSRILRDAFAKVEKRQLTKTSTFLETLNTTVLTELRDFRLQYDQIWQSTVLELSSQRSQSQHEVLALSARLTLLADDLVFQKRIATLQSILLLLCLVLFTLWKYSSSSSATPTHHLSHVLARSPPSPNYQSTLSTPPTSSSSTRPPSRYGIFRGLSPTHWRMPSEQSDLAPPPPPSSRAKGPSTDSSSVEFSPPTPDSRPSSGAEKKKEGVEEEEEEGAGSEAIEGVGQSLERGRSEDGKAAVPASGSE